MRQWQEQRSVREHKVKHWLRAIWEIISSPIPPQTLWYFKVITNLSFLFITRVPSLFLSRMQRYTKHSGTHSPRSTFKIRKLKILEKWLQHFFAPTPPRRAADLRKSWDLFFGLVCLGSDWKTNCMAKLSLQYFCFLSMTLKTWLHCHLCPAPAFGAASKVSQESRGSQGRVEAQALQCHHHRVWAPRKVQVQKLQVLSDMEDVTQESLGFTQVSHEGKLAPAGTACSGPSETSLENPTANLFSFGTTCSAWLWAAPVLF